MSAIGHFPTMAILIWETATAGAVLGWFCALKILAELLPFLCHDCHYIGGRPAVAHQKGHEIHGFIHPLKESLITGAQVIPSPVPRQGFL